MYDGPGYDGPGYDGPGYDGPGYDGPGYDEAGYDLEETHIVRPGLDEWGPDPDAGAYEDEYLDEPLDEERRPLREWLATIAQLVVGAVAGAALWLVFRWLWRIQPTVAAVAGVLVTVAAVLLVRRIWRSDDVRTIVMTVLIGLFVTMSPAVLLLDL